MALLFFGIGVKTDPFQSCGHCWVFQNSWHIDCSTLTRPSFRIWNSSAGIPPASTHFVCSNLELRSFDRIVGKCKMWKMDNYWSSWHFCLHLLIPEEEYINTFLLSMSLYIGLTCTHFLQRVLIHKAFKIKFYLVFFLIHKHLI